jgi:hypothetical protein
MTCIAYSSACGGARHRVGEGEGMGDFDVRTQAEAWTIQSSGQVLQGCNISCVSAVLTAARPAY